MGRGKLRDVSSRTRLLVSILSVMLPQVLKRVLLTRLLGYEIHSSARIGFSLIYPAYLVMRENSKIGSLTLCKGLTLLELGDNARIGNLNWITAVPIGATAFREEKERKAQLLLREHSAITNRHLIDCCNSVEIGQFSTFAGFRSQILTHSIDLMKSRQTSAPVTIGEYCFVGTGSVLLAGSKLPNYSVLGASACLTEAFSDEYKLYAGVPAKAVKDLSEDLGYFKRLSGYVL
jgi:acetyltransferase-like isoleucine patch superfamily enzyme